MRRLFRAGLIAASAQVMAVVAATVAVTLAFRYGLVIPASGAAEIGAAIRALSLAVERSPPGFRHCAHAKPVR